MEEHDETPAAEAEELQPRADVLSSGPSGVAGSTLERRAATRMAEELEKKGREVRVQEVRIPASASLIQAFHALLVIAASLVGLKWPAIGASLCVLATFSFYAERGLGMRLLGKVLPGRKTSNVVSPPPGPAWEQVETIFAAGYDLPDSYPVGEWLSRRFSGRFTTDRILFYGGMIGTFAALMMRAVGIEDLALSIFQTATTAIAMAVLAAQIDRKLAGTPVATQEDLVPARDAISAAIAVDDEAEGESGVGICLFGAEYSSAGGASAFFGDRKLKLQESCTVTNLIRGARGAKPEVTGREGDLMPTRMNPELAAKSPLRPKAVALRSQTAATVARRLGLRATTVVGRGEPGIDVMLDIAEASVEQGEAS